MTKPRKFDYPLSEEEILAALEKNERPVDLARRTGIPLPKIYSVRKKAGLGDPAVERLLVRITPRQFDAFVVEADRRKMMVDGLASKLIRQIIDDNLFAAVLDDD